MSGSPSSPSAEELSERLDVLAARMAESHQRMIGVLDDAISGIGTTEAARNEPAPAPLPPTEPAGHTGSAAAPTRPARRLAWQSNLIAGVVALIVLIVALVVVNGA
ncbi:MAG: hypothetical protein M3063_03425 [Actinomycetota bacterium]|nr:hypothetical protein [Actinomycetota bacterium]